MLLLNHARVVLYQDLLLMENASAQLLKPYGMELVKLAHAQSIHSVIIVNHAQPQESGINQPINAFALPQPMFGMEINASAQLVDSALAVLNAQPQEDGILLLINAFATHHLSGMGSIVFAHNLISYIKVDVQNVQQDLNGLITDVKNVTVIIKIWKFSLEDNFEIDQFICFIYSIF